MGAFKGGMTEIMMNPIADYIRSKGGTIATASPVSELLLKDGRLIGAVSEGRTYMADYTIQATSLGPAQNLLQKSFPEHPDFQNMYKLKTMPSVTIQMELSSRSMEKDRTTFAPQTCLASFAEQNHSTFPHIPGRLSVILTPPERFLNKPREEVLEIVCRDFEKINLFIRDKVTDYRMVIEPQEFYALVPGMEKYKPKQKTSIPNLYLAGDYTRQRYMATMEGAVYAGYLAAKTYSKRP